MFINYSSITKFGISYHCPRNYSMKQIIFLLFILLFTLNYSYTQEEIWGYHSLAGSEGGGMIFTVYPEEKEVETIHRFGHGYLDYDFPTNPSFFDNGNGLLYGSIEEQIYSYDPFSQEIIVLLDSLDFGQLVAIDDNYLYGTKIADTIVDVFAFDIQNNTEEWLMAIPKYQGWEHQGQWLKLDNGKFYTLSKYSGSEGKGTLIEIDVENASSRKSIDFVDAKKPIGSLILHENGFIYGATTNGGENDEGVIFKLDPKGDSYIIEASFNSATGRIPKGEMLKADDGKLYGVTSAGGNSSGGTIYAFDPSNSNLQAVYHVYANSSEFQDHGFSGYLSQLANNKMVGVLQSNYSYGSGKLFSFDILTKQFEILFDFKDSELKLPFGKIHVLDEDFLGLFSNFRNQQRGGVYKYNSNLNEIEVLNMFGINIFPELGQNPKWMCQGGDGNVYGITHYGGKENKGILFKIDLNSHEFTKKLDLADVNMQLLPSSKGFSIGNGKIIGFSNILPSLGKLSEKSRYIFEYDFIQNSLSKIIDLEIPSRLYSEPKLNDKGNIYFSSNEKFFEYNYHKQELEVTPIAELDGVKDLVEYLPNIYIGSCTSGGSVINDFDYGMLFSWNPNDIEVNLVLDMSRFYPTGSHPANPTNHLFCTSNGILYGDYNTFETKYNWTVPFVYDIASDSIIENKPFNTFISDFRRNALLEESSELYLLQNRISGGEGSGEVRVYNTQTGEQDTIPLEKSPFFYNFSDGDIEETNAPFDALPKVNLICIKPNEEKSYWIGEKDSSWYNGENWYSNKVPLIHSDVIISKNALFFPTIDTLIELKNLEIERGAKITIGRTGSLSCKSLINKGDFKMNANKKQKASFICDNGALQSGGFHYEYQSSKSDDIYLGTPVSNMLWHELGVISTFEYQDGKIEDMLIIDDSTMVLEAMKPYVFNVDSSQLLDFRGAYNWSNFNYSFMENRFYLLSNPYPCSFDWSNLDLSNLTHQALYLYSAEKNEFISIVDGIGEAAPLIQPLSVFAIYAEQKEEFKLVKSDKIHAVNYLESSNSVDHLLKLKLSGLNECDYTIINFNQNASYGFDKTKDALIFPNITNSKGRIFTFGDGEELAINQLPDTTMMDLSVKCQSNGTFTISIDSNMGYEYLVLEDLIWKKRINLLEESYTFDYFASDGNYPFKLYFTDWVLQPVEESDIEVYYYPESIVVRSRKMVEQAEIIFYDLTGKAVLSYTENDFFKFEKAISLPTGHYIVQVRTPSFVKNTKVLIRH